MQCRRHWFIRFRDLCNWPPLWVRLGTADGKAPKAITGENWDSEASALLPQPSRQNVFDGMLRSLSIRWLPRHQRRTLLPTNG
jgi:hypothetical protein